MSSLYAFASLHGIGDLCLVAGLLPRFCEVYNTDVALICKEEHLDVARMYGHERVTIKTMTSAQAERYLAESRPEERLVGRTPRNALDGVIIAHPEYCLVRGDYCVAKGRMTDVAMYALILSLSPWEMPARPVQHADAYQVAHIAEELAVVSGKTVMIFQKANSWPVPVDSGFWMDLASALIHEGWTVVYNDPDKIPLSCVVPLVEMCGWAIGANSGIMQLIAMSRCEARKTIITPSIDHMLNSYPLPISGTYPYRLHSSVEGVQLDIEEYLLDRDNHDEVIRRVATGYNAHGTPNYAEATRPYMLPTSPGDIIDRLIILKIKASRLPEKQHMLYREMVVLEDLRGRLPACDKLDELEARLYHLNKLAWEKNEILFDGFVGDYGTADWTLAPDGVGKAEQLLKAFRLAGIEANQERVRVKNMINVLCGSSAREEKSYET